MNGLKEGEKSKEKDNDKKMRNKHRKDKGRKK